MRKSFVQKNRMYTVCILLMVMLSPICFTMVDVPEVQAETEEYFVTEDAYIKNGTDKDKNFGTAAELVVKDVADSYGLDRTTYIKVDFSGFKGKSVTSAELRIYCVSLDNDSHVTLFGFNDDNWSESTVTWNNPPNESDLTVISSQTVFAQGEWYTFDVTSFINSQMSDKVASFKLKNKFVAGFHKFSSSEAASNQPKLILDTSPPPPPKTKADMSDKFVDSIGVNTHLYYNGTIYDTAFNSIIKPKLGESGIRHVRDSNMNRYLSSTDNKKIWDRMIELNRLYGIKYTILATLIDKDNDGEADDNDSSWLSKAYEYAKFGSTWAAVSGINEPDSSSGTNWIERSRIRQQTIWDWSQESAPSLDVIGPVPADLFNYYKIGDLSDILDYGDMHVYGGTWPNTYRSFFGRFLADRIRESRFVRGGKDLYITETGHHNALASKSDHKPVTETAAAKDIPSSLFYFYNMGIKRTFIYEFIDQGTDNTKGEQMYGLLRNDGSEKPVFTTLKRIISLLNDPGEDFITGSLDYTLSGYTTNVQHTLLQKRNGVFYLVLWLDRKEKISDTTVSQNVTLTFNESVYQANTYLMRTSEDPVAAFSNPVSINLSVPDEVLIVEVKKPNLFD
ncbi:DNRLRE domain-containing protein [Paenibacillus tarimensis]